MNTTELKKFAQSTRRQLIGQVGAKLDLVLQDDSAVLRGQEKALQQLQDEISKSSKDAVIDRVAYIWFNRFCALQFMDVNRYSRIGAISSAGGFSQPEILQDAKQGHIDDELKVEKQKVLDLLGGQATAADPQQEAYRLLLVAVCNSYHRLMPFMFERIADYTELLMPEDLLSENSVLHAVRETLTEETCQDVEVIGWLYQFYISEKKDEVFAGLKKNIKITPENIPAATQLFTPHWIVSYLVENSLGRIWMLNHPDSRLIKQMEYYIKPEEAETDFLKIKSPEEIKICDPACGSGHMLTYAFDLLYSIYEEKGYDSKDIPRLILTKNLYGIEIDERAGELAAFALFMKAREKYRRFFRKAVQPNICILENVNFDEGELNNYMDEVGRDLFTLNLQSTLHQFREIDNFGSLIRPDENNVNATRRRLQEKNLGGNLFLFQTHQKVLRVLKQVDFLSQKYHVVIANPPYFGPKQMNVQLKEFAKVNYPNTKTDSYAMFVERAFTLTIHCGYVAMVTMQSWMFLHSFESMRNDILRSKTILSMAHLGARAFETISGEVVTVTAFSCFNGILPEYSATFLRLIEGDHIQKEKGLREKDHCYSGVRQSDFEKLPGSPIAYWIGEKLKKAFEGKKVLDFTISDGQNITADNDRFVRYHWEVDEKLIGRGNKWLPYSKGGPFRRWYGNQNFVVDWSDGARWLYHKNSSARIIPEYLWYRPGVTWSRVGTTLAGFRLLPENSTFDKVGSSVFLSDDNEFSFVLGLLNTRVAQNVLDILNPSIDIQIKDVRNIPVIQGFFQDTINNLISRLIEISKKDWDFVEVSMDFYVFPLLQPDQRRPTLKATYLKLRVHWQDMMLETQRLEEENNRLFIEAYDLEDELKPEIPFNEVTLTCNPHYRYKGNKSKEELEALLLADTMKEFLSYAVGCMFGRYSLDKPGLILANRGETIEDYLQQIPKPSFPADEDNVIPILDQDWFSDDLTSRFSEFLKITFGEEHYEENLKFITDAIGKDIRKYFLKDFYKDHLKTYKKRPIYWLFSSPKGSFNALIYMHRYRPDTVSVILNDYLREFRTKLQNAQENLEQLSISVDATKTEKTKSLKQIEKLKKIISELDTYENETLYPLATQNIEIDLDDGVKVNYKKFGRALKKVPGLS